jgi:pimeloyl-ACP methyl ester carboxylesterase
LVSSGSGYLEGVQLGRHSTTRCSPEGDYAELRGGATHFTLEGPEGGMPLLLVHGATVPLWEFDRLVPPLHVAGFRTLRFDLYGHGLSHRPPVDYTLDLFVEQAAELLEATRFPRPTAVLGHSLGAAIAARLAAARPLAVDRLVLVAPMLDFNATSRWTPAFRFPGIGEALMRFVGVPALVRRRRRRYAGIGQPHLSDWFVEQVAQPGFGRALLSMIRSETLGDQSACYSALRELSREVLVISGNDDAVIPPRDIARVCELLGACRRAEIAGAQHNLLLTHPEPVVEALRALVPTPLARVAGATL